MRRRTVSLVFLVILVICMTFPVSAKPARMTADYPVHGTTTADLSPINDYVSALYDNGIYLTIPEQSDEFEEYGGYEWSM